MMNNQIWINYLNLNLLIYYWKINKNQFPNHVFNPKKPVAAPRRSVKQMVQEYEKNIIKTPVPKPRTIKSKPVPAIRTQIKPLQQALKSSLKSYEVNI